MRLGSTQIPEKRHPFEVEDQSPDDEKESLLSTVPSPMLIPASRKPIRYRLSLQLVVTVAVGFLFGAFLLFFLTRDNVATQRPLSVSEAMPAPIPAEDGVTTNVPTSSLHTTSKPSTDTPTQSPTTAMPTSQPTSESTHEPTFILPTSVPSSYLPTISPSLLHQPASANPSVPFHPQSQTNAPTSEPRLKFYTIARTDRAGSAIKEMMLAHAHAYATNTTFGGACVDAIDWEGLTNKHGPSFRHKVEDRLVERQKLIDVLGLHDELPLACPSEDELKSGRVKLYRKRGPYKGTLFPPAWFSYLQSKTEFAYKTSSPEDPLQIVVHVRRGDFTPCHVSDRYLPNVYFIEALDYYLPQYCNNARPCNITIYSQRDSYEPLDVFEEKNYTLDFDSTAPEIWQSIVDADLFVMSQSAFSFIPACLNRKHGVVSPYSDIAPWLHIPGRIYSHAYVERKKQMEACP